MRIDILVKIGLITLGLLLLLTSATADLSGISIHNTRDDPVMGPIQISSMVISVLISAAGASLFLLWRPTDEVSGEDEGADDREDVEDISRQAYAAAERPRPPREAQHTIPMDMATIPSLGEDDEGHAGEEESLDADDLEDLELLEGLDDLGTEEDVDEYACPTCGHPVKFDDMECPYCGESFTDEYNCPSCGMSIEEGATVCSNCGELFDPDEYDQEFGE